MRNGDDKIDSKVDPLLSVGISQQLSQPGCQWFFKRLLHPGTAGTERALIDSQGEDTIEVELIFSAVSAPF